MSAPVLLGMPNEVLRPICGWLPVDDIKTLWFVCRRFRALLIDQTSLRAIAELASEKEIARISLEKNCFDYNGVPFIQALRHWIQHKEVFLFNTRYTATWFALWYIRCNEGNASDATRGPRNLYGFDVYAENLILLHFSRHRPQQYPASFNTESPKTYIERIKALSGFPSYAQVTNAGPGQRDWERIFDDSDFLQDGIDPKFTQTRAQALAIYYSPTYWCLSGTELGFLTLRGVARDSLRLRNIFGLEPIVGKFIAYWARNAHTAQLAGRAMNEQPLDLLVRPKFLEGVYVN